MWTAVEGYYGERRIFVRCFKDQPLVVSRERYVLGFIRYERFNARAFYATIHVYKNLASTSMPGDLENIAYNTPSFDINGSLDEYRSVLDVASSIIDYPEKRGLEESVYILWSGEGAHVRMNEKAFSREILSKYNSLNIAYSIVGIADASRYSIANVILAWLIPRVILVSQCLKYTLGVGWLRRLVECLLGPSS